MKNIPKDQIFPYFLLLNSTLYIMISIITVLLAQVLLKWHWTFSPPFRNLIFRITRVELKSGLNKDITYFLLVHFHLNSSLKIFNYSFQTRRDHLLFFSTLVQNFLTDHSMYVRNLPALCGCSQQVKTGGDQYGNPLDLISWGGKERWKTRGEPAQRRACPHVLHPQA